MKKVFSLILLSTLILFGAATLDVKATNDLKIKAKFDQSYVIDANDVLWSLAENISIADNVQDIAIGQEHLLVLKKDNSLWAKGSNSEGQLGTDTITYANDLIKIMDNVKMISCGSYHSLVITNDNELYAFGNNEFGQLGDLTSVNKYQPQKIMSNIIYCEAGYLNSFVINSNNELYAFGNNEFGQLGLNHQENILEPTLVTRDVSKVAAGELHTLVLKKDHKLYSVGLNSFGQLGLGNNTDNQTLDLVASSIIDISAGSYHSLYLNSNNDLYSFGNNTFGQLGINDQVDHNTPVKILSNVSSIQSGSYHNIVIQENKILGFGLNDQKQLNDLANIIYQPALIQEENFLEGNAQSSFIALSSLNNSVLGLKADGALWYFELDAKPQLLLEQVKSAVFSQNRTNETILALKNDGNVYLKKKENANFEKISDLTNIKKIAVGANHFLALSNDNKLYAMGDNTYGQLGTGNNTALNSFKLVMDQVKDISCGYNYSLVIKTDNSLWGFGQNDNYQLGLGSNKNINVPTLILKDVKKVSAQATHTLILKQDNSLYAVGNNDFGQLGTGNFDVATKPIQIMTNIKDISGGLDHSLVLDQNDTLFGFGNNEFGQLAQGHKFNQAQPVKIAEKVTLVMGSNELTVFQKVNGDLFYAGHDQSQLKYYPYKVIGLDASQDINYPFAYNSSNIYYLTNVDSVKLKNNDIDVRLDNKIIKVLKEGNFTLTITKNGVTKDIQVKSKQTALINGIENNKVYSQPVNIVLKNQSNVKLNGKDFSGGMIQNNGSYVLTYSNSFGMNYEINFKIDTNKPVINVYYSQENKTNQDVIVYATTNKGTLNQDKYIFKDNGKFTFVAYDGISTVTKEVTVNNIDKISPVVEGVINDRTYDTDVKITFNEGNATLNGEAIKSNTVVSKNGDYSLIVVDEAGNKVEINFKIRKIILGDVNGDNKISPLDYVKIKNHIMGNEIITEGNALIAADYNEDGKISPLDYVGIKNYIMNGGN